MGMLSALSATSGGPASICMHFVTAPTPSPLPTIAHNTFPPDPLCCGPSRTHARARSPASSTAKPYTSLASSGASKNTVHLEGGALGRRGSSARCPDVSGEEESSCACVCVHVCARKQRTRENMTEEQLEKKRSKDRESKRLKSSEKPFV